MATFKLRSEESNKEMRTEKKEMKIEFRVSLNQSVVEAKIHWFRARYNLNGLSMMKVKMCHDYNGTNSSESDFPEIEAEREY